MLTYGSVSVDPPLILAPMAGVTDRDFRLIVRRIGGVGVVSMEFISSRAIVHGNRRTRELMHFCDEERPLAIQIYGSDAATMARGRASGRGARRRHLRHQHGLPGEQGAQGLRRRRPDGRPRAGRVDRRGAARESSIPLTVKFRLGLDDCRRNYLELGRICEANGVAAVAMHARTARQMFSGQADWSHIARLKETLSIPVIGNGDVTTPEDALRDVRRRPAATA